MIEAARTALAQALKWTFLALALAACAVAQAQSWPARPLRILVPYPAGGSTDILTRLFAQRLAESLGHAVLVENRGGASGGVAASYFAKAAPDDCYFMVVSLPMMSINQYLYPKLGYDPDADFLPIGLIGQTPNVVVVAPSLPVRTMKELAEYGKASGKLSYSSSSVGSAGHLLNELFKANAGIELLHVPYRGNNPVDAGARRRRRAVHHRQPAAAAAADTLGPAARDRSDFRGALVPASRGADRRRERLPGHDHRRVVRPGGAGAHAPGGHHPHELPSSSPFSRSRTSWRSFAK